MQTRIEYAILREINGGSSYITMTFTTLNEAIYILKHNFIDEHEKKGKMYFVDNDFFDNPYKNFRGLQNFYYYKIISRKITSWEDYNYFDNDILKEHKGNLEKNNILKFPIFSWHFYFFVYNLIIKEID